jgi:polyisoprenoid-binding protein YceI
VNFLFRILFFWTCLILLTGCARKHGDALDVTWVSPSYGSVYALDSDASLQYSGTILRTIKHTGGFREVTGTIVIPDGMIDAAHIDIVVDMTSVWSNQRDPKGNIMIEDFFEVDVYPEARFVSTSMCAVESGYEVEGNLTLHGITKALRFPVRIELLEKGKRLSTAAEFPVDRTAFDIHYPGLLDHLIQHKVMMRFDVNATVRP